MVDEIFDIIKQEEQRLKEMIPLIPSENIASEEVMAAVGSSLMNKYAEGYPKKRYYQGNSNSDKVEQLCKDRALEAFGLNKESWGVNVQPHSGCEANLAVYNALLNIGDRILSMYLPDGGHLSHGWQLPDRKVSIVSKIFEPHYYKVNGDTGVFDYDEVAKIAKKVKPRLIISGGTAYPREIDYKRMREIADSVGAYYLADVSHEAGLILSGANKSPFQYADVVTFTTHKTLRGPRGAVIFSRRNYKKTPTSKKSDDLSAKIDFGVFPGLQGGPHLHTIAGIAVALKQANTAAFNEYSHQIVKNAKLFAKIFAQNGFDVVSGGTDKHLVLLDLRNKKIEAWIAAWALEHVNIILNRNTVPAETASPYYPSGLRLGTPAMTTRGMKEPEVKKIALWIIDVIEYCKQYPLPEDKDERVKLLKWVKSDMAKEKFLVDIKKKVKELSEQFPLFQE